MHLVLPLQVGICRTSRVRMSRVLHLVVAGRFSDSKLAVKGFIQPQTEKGVTVDIQLVPLHCTKFPHNGKKPPDMYVMHCSLFLILFATRVLAPTSSVPLARYTANAIIS